MNITLKKIGMTMLLASGLLSTTAAFAQSGLYANPFVYVSQNDDRNRSNQDRRGNDDNRQSQDRFNSNNANRNADRADQARRDPKLSPDERRALRRQIDEAGRDIYAPRR